MDLHEENPEPEEVLDEHEQISELLRKTFGHSSNSDSHEDEETDYANL
jgi:hypothetical protein